MLEKTNRAVKHEADCMAEIDAVEQRIAANDGVVRECFSARERAQKAEAERDRLRAELSALASLVRCAAPHSWAQGTGERNQRDADAWQERAVALLESMDRW